MRKLMLFVVLVFFAAGCAAQPQLVDNGKPGRISAVIFFDQNKNGVQDAGEPGAAGTIGLSQDVSCPAANLGKVSKKEADAQGGVFFENLKPGHYCVSYFGDKGLTTKQNRELDLSSEQTVQVFFGLSEK